MWYALPTEGVARLVPRAASSTVSRAHPEGLLALLGELARRFEEPRQRLLLARRLRHTHPPLANGGRPDTRWIRSGRWTCDHPAATLALSPAVDLHGSMAPTLLNVEEALDRLHPDAPVLRPRGLEALESCFDVDNAPLSATLHDVGHLMFRSTAAERITLCLPRVDGFAEALWFRDVLGHLEAELGRPDNSVAVVLGIDHVNAVNEVEEVLFALRDRVVAVGLNPAALLASEIERHRSDAAFVSSSIAPRHEALQRIAAKRGVRVLGPDLTPVMGSPPRTLEGLTACVRTAMGFLHGWMRGDAAIRVGERSVTTDEAAFCHAQVWHWVHHGAALADGPAVTASLLADVLTETQQAFGDDAVAAGQRLYQRCTAAEFEPLVPTAV